MTSKSYQSASVFPQSVELILNEVYHLYLEWPGRFHFLAYLIADPFL